MDVSEEIFPYGFDGTKWDSASFDVAQKRRPDFYLRLPGTLKQRKFRTKMKEKFIDTDTRASDISVELDEMFRTKHLRAKRLKE